MNQILLPIEHFGGHVANRYKRGIYLAWQPMTQLVLTGQSSKSIVNRSREHLESINKIQDGRLNLCQMRNNTRAFYKYILTEIIILGDTST